MLCGTLWLAGLQGQHTSMGLGAAYSTFRQKYGDFQSDMKVTNVVAEAQVTFALMDWRKTRRTGMELTWHHAEFNFSQAKQFYLSNINGKLKTDWLNLAFYPITWYSKDLKLDLRLGYSIDFRLHSKVSGDYIPNGDLIFIAGKTPLTRESVSSPFAVAGLNARISKDLFQTKYSKLYLAAQVSASLSNNYNVVYNSFRTNRYGLTLNWNYELFSHKTIHFRDSMRAAFHVKKRYIKMISLKRHIQPADVSDHHHEMAVQANSQLLFFKNLDGKKSTASSSGTELQYIREKHPGHPKLPALGVQLGWNSFLLTGNQIDLSGSKSANASYQIDRYTAGLGLYPINRYYLQGKWKIRLGIQCNYLVMPYIWDNNAGRLVHYGKGNDVLFGSGSKSAFNRVTATMLGSVQLALLRKHNYHLSLGYSFSYLPVGGITLRNVNQFSLQQGLSLVYGWKGKTKN